MTKGLVFDCTAEKPATVVIVMGVSGSGKSTIGQVLATRMNAIFLEGDEFHPPSNVAKMEHGIALTDDDRAPWLQTIVAAVAGVVGAGDCCVVSCSALKRAYRDILRVGIGQIVRFVYLHGDEATLVARMSSRTGHFMPTSLLQSQIASLEPPLNEPDVVTIEVEDNPDVIVGKAVAVLRQLALADKANA
ncbi:gluconokinase [Rhizobium leguminosarum]|uniref:gluconokinase n=1 Tax=Rhizobium leguminosarum TaxID=384 RepID=UPI001C91F4A6|nr:gluconokinase [Rhizobium leguminosarum]MBY3002053.1 gluconokinase [Rhizobium leguminosarum]